MGVELGMVAHTFNPSIWEAEAGESLEFEASLVYRTGLRTTRNAQRDLLLKHKSKAKQKVTSLGKMPDAGGHH